MHDALAKVYADFSRGDMDAVLAACDDSIVFHVPGSNPLAGNYAKGEFVPGLLTKVMRIAGDTFREEVLEIMTGENYGCVLLDHTFTKNGRPQQYYTIHLWSWNGERFTGWWEHPRSERAFDEAWS